jgi:hypothetical protein
MQQRLIDFALMCPACDEQMWPAAVECTAPIEHALTDVKSRLTRMGWPRALQILRPVESALDRSAEP